MSSKDINHHVAEIHVTVTDSLGGIRNELENIEYQLQKIQKDKSSDYDKHNLRISFDSSFKGDSDRNFNCDYCGYTIKGLPTPVNWVYCPHCGSSRR